MSMQATNKEDPENDIYSINFNNYVKFLTSVFSGSIETNRVNSLYLGVLDNILNFISKSSETMCSIRASKVVECFFVIKTIHMNMSYHKKKVYTTDNDSLFLRLHLSLYDLITLRIKENDFTFISALFSLFVQKFQIFQKKLSKMQFYKKIHSIEMKIISKLLSYLTGHLHDHLGHLGPQYFLCARVFLNRVRVSPSFESDPNLTKIVKEFYHNLQDILLSKNIIRQSNVSSNSCLFQAIHLLSDNVKSMTNLILDYNRSSPQIWRELKLVVSLLLEIDCTRQMSSELFSNQGILLSNFLPKEGDHVKEKTNKTHLLLIHSEMTSLLKVSDSSFGALACQYFRTIMQFLLIPLANLDDPQDTNLFILNAYFQSNGGSPESSETMDYCSGDIFKPELFFKKFDRELVSQTEREFFDFLVKYELDGISKDQMKEMISKPYEKLLLIRGVKFIQNIN